MPDWSSPGEVQLDAGVFVKFIHALMGLYAWEWFLTVDFDWEVVTRKRPFKLPVIFYFANRYLLFFALIGVLISFDTTTELNCQALYIFNQLAGNASVGLASINLCLRTIAIYRNYRPLVVLLVIIILGHWALILQAGVLLKVAWSDETNQCEIVQSNNHILVATFMYSMVFDLLVFLLNAYKLSSRKENAIGASRLGRMLFEDGLVYFFIAFLSNLLATVFMFLNLNSIMSVIFNIPAAIASTIVACRVVRRLFNFQNEGPEMFNSGAHLAGVQLRRASGMRPGAQTNGPHSQIGSGVHVQIQMETYSEPVVESISHPSPTDIDLHLRYGDTELKRDSGSYDVEKAAAI